MAKVKKVSKKVRISLTPKQIETFAAAFGKDFAKRVKSLEVDKVEGFLRANVKVN